MPSKKVLHFSQETFFSIRGTVILFTVITILYGCQQNQVSNVPPDLEFIQVKNAISERHYDWIRTDFQVENVSQENRFNAYSMAADAWSNGSNQNLSKAFNFLQTAEKLAPDDQNIKNLIIKNLNRAGEWEALEKRLAANNNPLLKAQIYLEIDPEKVIGQLNQINKSEQGLLFNEITARYHHGQNSSAAALQAVDLAEELGSLNPLIYYIGQQSAYQLNQVEKALYYQNIYQNLKRLKSEKNPRSMLALVDDLLKSNSAFQSNDEFNVLYIRLLLSNSQSTNAQNMLQEIDPNFLPAEYLYELLSSLISSSHFQTAYQWIESMQLASADARNNHLICLIKSQILEPEQAIQSCQSASDTDPWNAQIHHQISVLLFQTLQPKLAKDSLQKAISFAPWNESWRIQLAQAFLTDGQVKEAIKILDEAIDNESQLILQFKQMNGLYSL